MKGSRHNNHTEPLAKQHRHEASFMIMMPAFPLLYFLFASLNLQHDENTRKYILVLLQGPALRRGLKVTIRRLC